MRLFILGAVFAVFFQAAFGAAETGNKTSRQDVTKQVKELVAREKIVKEAMSLIGVDYWPGGQDSNYGYDCSGLTQYVYSAAGISIPRVSVEQYKASVKADLKDLRKGDLVFFNTRGLGPTHVGVYLGGGRFVHAPGVGRQVRVNSMSERYWRERFFFGGKYLK